MRLIATVLASLSLTTSASAAVHYSTFQTGTDGGQHYPAAICHYYPMDEGELYCWTPNDGYTIALGGYPLGDQKYAPPHRLRSEESRNRHRVVPGA